MHNLNQEQIYAAGLSYCRLLILSYAVVAATNQLAVHSANQTSAEPGNPPTNQTVTLPSNQPLNQPANQPAAQSANQSAAQPAKRPKLPPELDPKLIEPLLKQQFKMIKPVPSSLNPFPTIVPRSGKVEVADPTDDKFIVLSAQEFDHKGFFRKQKILLITVSPIVLEARIMTANRSTGIFAFDGNQYTYLNGSEGVTNVINVLRKENRSLTEFDPEALAKFFTMTILRHDNDRVDVVQSPKDILCWDRPNAALMNEKIKKMGLKRTYACTVDKVELDKWKAQLMRPQVFYDAKSGWRCHFAGLLGWMHTIRVPFSLVEYDILVSPKFELKINSHILSAKIMS